jgi:16S rRNA (adenine1518-N6/adenine1519-N6)-dimethyltransferase
MRKKIPNAIIPKKHLGQNFLVNANITQRIIDSCQISEKETILEIGPGLGALTKEIANRSEHVYAVETDKRLYDQLTDAVSLKKINLIHADFLKCDLSFLPQKTKVIGNLPYKISTPIIEKLINNRQLFQDLFLTVQLEFGKRLAAKPNSKDYGSLSCFVQYYCDTKILFKIRNSCFRPIPKVTSCFVHLRFRPAKIKAKDEDHLLQNEQKTLCFIIM